MNILYLFRTRSLAIRLGFGILLLAIVALTDYLTGLEIATSIFYLIVVVYFSAIFGARDRGHLLHDQGL